MKNRKRITKLNGGAPSITVKINRKINFVGHLYVLQGAARVFSVLFVMPPTKNTQPQHDGQNILHTCGWYQQKTRKNEMSREIGQLLIKQF